MKLSKKSEYALRALIELTHAFNGRSLHRHDIARRQRIPTEFLEQILLALKHAGLLTTQRGVHGGYRLIKPPDRITLGAVIRLMDGPLAPIGCVSVTAYRKCQDCPYARKVFCPLQNVMGGVRNAIAQILDNYTLEDFAADKGPPRAHGTRRPPSEKGRRTARRAGGRSRPLDP